MLWPVSVLGRVAVDVSVGWRGAECEDRGVPSDGHVPAILEALDAAGAGRVGRYDRVTSFWQTAGTWRPMPGAEPIIRFIPLYESELD